MVATQGQSHALPDPSNHIVEDHEHSNIHDKRKREGENFSNVVKRRRSILDLGANSAIKPAANSRARLPAEECEGPDSQSNISVDSDGAWPCDEHARKSLVNDTDSGDTPHTTKGTEDRESIEVCDLQGDTSEMQQTVAKVLDDSGLTADDLDRPARETKKMAGSKKSDTRKELLHDNEFLSSSHQKTATPAIHRRFGGEDAAESMLHVPDGSSGKGREVTALSDSSGNTEESEDDAPETMTAATALNNARMAAAEAVRAADIQAAAKKKRRKEHEFHRMKQAQLAKKNRHSHRNGISEEAHVASNTFTRIQSDPFSIPRHSRSTNKAQLPELLPEEILSAVPDVRPPTPPADCKENPKYVPKKHRFLDSAPKPPKDIRRGPVHVRVSEIPRTVLAPRASKTSKACKEAWLTGRGGEYGSAGIERRKIGGGFVRR